MYSTWYLVARTSTSGTIARVLPQYVCMQHVYASFLHGHVRKLHTQVTILVPPCNIVTSEAEEWLILVQRGYYNNPVPAYFSTSHRLF